MIKFLPHQVLLIKAEIDSQIEKYSDVSTLGHSNSHTSELNKFTDLKERFFLCAGMIEHGDPLIPPLIELSKHRQRVLTTLMSVENETKPRHALRIERNKWDAVRRRLGDTDALGASQA